MSWLATNRKLRERIALLEAENEELKYKAGRYDVILAAKRDWNERRRKLFEYVHYRNFMGVAPRYWPEVLCCDCKHVRPDGSAKQAKWKCSQLGTRVGKYSSCDWAKSKAGNSE